VNIGFMQGRLSPIFKKKIQSFPWNYWRKEIFIAKKNNFNLMEWTLDYPRLFNNPLISSQEQKKTLIFLKKNKIFVNSVTCDFFMQKPFFLIKNKKKFELNINNLLKIIKRLINAKIQFIVIPLVDKSSIKNTYQEKLVIREFNKIIKNLNTNNFKTKILFEIDYSPSKLKKFIKKFSSNFFGINYDSGNSASLNYNIDDEFNYYGNRILNVHIKDKVKYGKTIKLGQGNVNFFKLKKNLRKIHYNRNLILQTARNLYGKHLSELIDNRNFLIKNLN
jgi:L-ribulose-5-phosphate 3-epimerase